MTKEAVNRYPLAWPSGWPRTRPGDRKRATFAKSQARDATEQVWRDGAYREVHVKRRHVMELTSADAADRLERQLEALGADRAILSTNQQLRMDGRPKSNMLDPHDCGAAVYFNLNGKDMVLACDKWDRLADNIAALAAHIDALRRIDRYGVGSLDQAFAGYVGLPAKGQTWRTTLGFGPDEIVTVEMVERAFRERSKSAHPDIHGGSHDAMASLTSARAEARTALSA